MLSLLQRIPSLWIALIVGAIGSNLYLRYLAPKSAENDFVRDRVFTIVLLFILFSRFSGVILHPSANIRGDLLSLLSGSSSSGWIVGLIASLFYALVSVWRAKRMNQPTLFLFAEALCSGSIVFFAFQSYVNLNPFRMEDILRMIGSGVLVWLIRKHRTRLMLRAQWIWGGYGLLLLLTSTYVPHVNSTLFLTTPQWMSVLLMVIAAYVEGKYDLNEKHHITSRHGR